MINIMSDVANFPMILGAHMTILIIIKAKIAILIKWSYDHFGGTRCSITHVFLHKAHDDVKKWSVEGDESNVELISTSCTQCDVQTMFILFCIF